MPQYKSNIGSTLFSYCSALSGGALYFINTDFILNNDTFHNNSAVDNALNNYGQGGGIYLEYPMKSYSADMVYCNFSDNYASVRGGAIQ